ncbi:MAG: hypothetical protein Q9174_002529 [Haloplaca sp. 1 TL-2023]
MDPFSLQLPSGGTVTGLRTPAFPAVLPKDTPLIVGIHGGGYSSAYYHTTPTNSAAPYSTFLRVPFLSIDRPAYKGSTAIKTPLPEDSTYLQEEGKHLHHEILPAIWAAYSKEYGVSSIVVMAHSLSVPMTVVTAALHAESASKAPSVKPPAPSTHMTAEQVEDFQNQPKEAQQQTVDEEQQNTQKLESTRQHQPYPLAGIVLSGLGTSLRHDTMQSMQPFLTHQGDRMTFPAELKDNVMLCGRFSGLVEPEVFEMTEKLNTDVGIAELVDSGDEFWQVWCKRYTDSVKCPVLYNLASEEKLWTATEETVAAFAGLFTRSVRVDSGIVLGAPHSMELSRAGRGWYARVFGWAVECGVAHGLGKF